MKIAIITPIGRTDKYGYQYKEFTKLIIHNLTQFTDHMKVISSSRYIDQDLFKNKKIDILSNEDTWFDIIDGKEIFSIEKSAKQITLAHKTLKEEGYDVSIQIHINQYIPQSSFRGLRNSCFEMLEKNEPFQWLYKSYQCGRMVFNSDRKLPWIFNLKKPLNWRNAPDSIINIKTGQKIGIQSGNYRKYNNQAIRDVSWDFTIEDAKEKYLFVIKEYRRINSRDVLKNPHLLQFNEENWLKYSQMKVNKRKKSKIELGEIGEKLVKLRKNSFISLILEKNYKAKRFYSNLFKSSN